MDPSSPGTRQKSDGGDSVIRARISSLSFFHGLDNDALEAVLHELEWFSLPGGQRLFAVGNEGDALYVVSSGRLGVFPGASERSGELIAEIGPGETIGEMALVTNETRSATVTALRDTELFRLSRDAFRRVSKAHPEIFASIASILAERLRRTTQRIGAAHPPQSLAVVPLNDTARCQDLVVQLLRALDRMGVRARVLNESMKGHETDWYNAIEANHDLTIFLTQLGWSSWTQLCFRQADRVLLVASGGARVDIPTSIQTAIRTKQPHSIELVILRDGSRPATLPERLDQMAVHLRHNVNLNRENDVARLARMLTNEAVGVVLSGGGARGLAHIGAMKALRAAGVPIDLTGGSSMGAIVAAGIALEWDDQELEERLRSAFVRRNPLSDVTIPFVSIFRGRKVTRLLTHHFGSSKIEQLTLPFFCVSSNLTTGQAMTHRSGLLRHALRASVTIPGLLPPVIVDGEVLVDGGVLNNLPVDVMRSIGRGPVIGVDVAADRAMLSANLDLEQSSIFRLLRYEKRCVPWILSTLIRAGTVSSDAQAIEIRRQADIVISPPLEAFDLLDWRSFDRIVELGYESTMRAIEKHGGEFRVRQYRRAS